MEEEVSVETKSTNTNLEATQAGKLVNSRIGSSVSLDNVQGVDFENSKVGREEFRIQRQMQDAEMIFFRRMRGDGGESARNVSGKPVNMPGKFLQPKSYLKLGKTYNSHFQIHNNLKVVSGQDIFFSDKGLMHVNMQSTKMASLLRRRCCVAMDMHNYEYLAVVEDPNTCHFVQLETNRVVKTSDFGFAGRELVNTLKFLDDRSGSLKIALGANSNLLRVYDVEAEGDPIHSFRVPYHVNYLCFDKEGKTAALGYDGNYVDLYDFRSGKRTTRLEGHKNHTFALDYHPSNIYLASGNEDETVRIWDLRMMKTAQILPMKSYPAGIVKYRDRGDILIVGENQQYVHAYDAGNNYNSVSTLDFFGTVIGLDLSPDQRELYVGVGCDEASVSGGILILICGHR